MVFSSLIFLFCFLPVTLAVYYATPRQHRNWPALLASLLFYAWGEPVFALVLAGSSWLDFRLSRLIENVQTGSKRRFWLLAAGVIYNVGLLGWFKYANFFAAQWNHIRAWIDLPAIGWEMVALPIGVSFFTFQKLSYLVDVYRGVTRASSNYRDYLLYVSLFPQLIAGPIVSYHDVDEQIRTRPYSVGQFLSGGWRFALGLGKKVLIANELARVADALFGLPSSDLTFSAAWLGLAAYSFQIYFDFSGYSDMAIGLGRMMGIEFKENFDHPYTSRSITEFWRRWHISLSNWMRDYLYFPLGGNRLGNWRTVFNLWTVFLISGFWHGASWNFVVWGGLHGFYISLEKLAGHRMTRIPKLPAQILTVFLACLAWVFFRAENLTAALRYLATLFDFVRWTEPLTALPMADLLDGRTTFVFLMAAIFSFMPVAFWQRLGWQLAQPRGLWGGLGRTVAASVLLILSLASLANLNYNPFIYFRF